jgi:hypothetical protein
MSNADLNAVLRAAAGRGPAPAHELEQRLGYLGPTPPAGTVGRVPRTLRRPAARSNALVNQRIRRAAQLARELTVASGVGFDLDHGDPYV